MNELPQVWCDFGGFFLARAAREKKMEGLSLPINRLDANLRGHPDILVMKPADALQLNDLPLIWRLDWPAARRILSQLQMSP
ncbi:MAG: hypothetical protein QNJ87_04145 [Gammaproteobacteria bacterium]|nr:hypothetical protein [Gammaproteobacteria bacterium]